MKSYAVMAVLLLASGCVKSLPPIQTSENLTVVKTDAMPAPARVDMGPASQTYVIGASDKLKIDVFAMENMDREVQVDAAGRIAYPLVGSIQAAGKTPQELSTQIVAGLRRKYVRNPEVTVNVMESSSQLITVDGQVEKPGVYPVLGRMTLMRAVASAGGASENAKLDDVVVFREVDGKKYAGLYNLQAIRRGTYADPELFANDVVVMGDSPAQRRFKDLIQAAPLLTTPLIILFNQL